MSGVFAVFSYALIIMLNSIVIMLIGTNKRKKKKTGANSGKSINSDREKNAVKNIPWKHINIIYAVIRLIGVTPLHMFNIFW